MEYLEPQVQMVLFIILGLDMQILLLEQVYLMILQENLILDLHIIKQLQLNLMFLVIIHGH